MSGVIETYAGIPAQLSATASDGDTGLFLRATIFNGTPSPVPVGAVNLDHASIGHYRASILLAVGVYQAVYRNFLNVGRTTLDPDHDHDEDKIIVHPLDEPRMGVAYDDATDTLLIEATLSRNKAPMLAADLAAAAVDVYDSDDNLIISISDLAPDALGVFRLSKVSPGLVADRHYYTRVTITTIGAGTVVANKGFHTTE